MGEGREEVEEEKVESALLAPVNLEVDAIAHLLAVLNEAERNRNSLALL